MEGLARRSERGAGPDHVPALCVLASSSSGNCSVLVVGRGVERRVVLLDLGLSPRKTAKLLGSLGLGIEMVSDVLLTHLDSDHAHSGWSGRPRDFRATLHVHRRHRGRGERAGLMHHRVEVFDADPFVVGSCAIAQAHTVEHDELGVAAFRIDLPGAAGPARLGYATDVGRATPGLVDHLAGVDVLAIESNYCPRMQIASDRPEMLKRRIMDGAGHLSNEQCAETVHAIEPADHVVFLHLSRECNRPELVSRLHEGADYGFTIASPDEPTRWVPVRSVREAACGR